MDTNFSKDTLRSVSEATEEELKRAWDSCARIAHENAGNFYYAFIFLPQQKRQGIEALYAFCRAGDDIADDLVIQMDSDDVKRDIFANLRTKLDQCYDGKFSDDKTLALCKAIERFKLKKEHFLDLLTGLESDLYVNRYETFAELELYCYRVASTVGLLCLNIFECDTDESRKYAEYLGIGMQITNILRDLKEDLDRDRIYLPQEDLSEFGFDDNNLFDKKRNGDLKKLVMFESERAQQFFTKADDQLNSENRSPLVVARIMKAIYQKILEHVLELKDFTQRVELSRWDKLKTAHQIFRDR